MFVSVSLCVVLFLWYVYCVISVCAYAHGLASDVFAQLFSTFNFWDRISHWTLSLSIFLDGLVNEFHRAIHLSLLSSLQYWGHHCMTSHVDFYGSAGTPRSDHHVCVQVVISLVSTFYLYLSWILLYTPTKVTQVSDFNSSLEISSLSPVLLCPRLTQMEFGIQSSAVRAAGRNPFCHPLRGPLSLHLLLTVGKHHLLPLVVSASYASFSAHRNFVLFFITPIGQAVTETKKRAHLSGVSSSPSPQLNNI